MEAHGDAPYYGWSADFFKKNLEYSPTGIFSLKENAGLSVKGGTAQETINSKQFVKLPSVEAGMVYLAEYIKNHNGNIARWYSTDEGKQEIYKAEIKKVNPSFVSTIIASQTK